MTKSQRILVLVGLILLAWSLNITFCEWIFRVPGVPWEPVEIIEYRHRIADGPDLFTGLLAAPDVSRPIAVFLGIIVPLTLLGFALFLVLGWRHQGRLIRGLCPECGYNLRGDRDKPVDTCPECGWQRKAS